MGGKIIVQKERKLNLLTWDGGLLCMDANLIPYWSHAQDQLAIQFLAWPQTSPF
jgi:hypothetical protein